MATKTIKQIEEEMDYFSKRGNIGKVMDLVDEHGELYDDGYKAIYEGNMTIFRIVEALGVDIISSSFLKAAVREEKEEILEYQVKMGADLDQIIGFAKELDKPDIQLWAQCHKDLRYPQNNKLI